jgi:hypothetical protein
MTTKEVTAIALRLFSLWLLVQVIMSIPSLVLLFTSIEQYQGQAIPAYVHIMIIGGFIVIGAIAVYLMWVAAKSALTNASDSGSELLGKDGQKFLLQLGGAYFVINALAYLPRSLGFLQSSMEVTYVNFLSPLGLLFQLCIGLALLVKASYWAEVFQKLRGRR